MTNPLRLTVTMKLIMGAGRLSFAVSMVPLILTDSGVTTRTVLDFFQQSFGLVMINYPT
ncbi:hypothetical protein HOLleu_23787 [Holothuria leucospilota]|uniref:Uncharacterized protein n=1 Tax=Holothuria leucospilota TaxID=206669 RepID=A0A9Q1H510_HOLLE|nr:hypothetical protein HOLleu_23787 [Holothuria leucospilota]